MRERECVERMQEGLEPVQERESVLADYAGLEFLDPPRPEEFFSNPDTAGACELGPAEVVLGDGAEQVLFEITYFAGY